MYKLTNHIINVSISNDLIGFSIKIPYLLENKKTEIYNVTEEFVYLQFDVNQRHHALKYFKESVINKDKVSKNTIGNCESTLNCKYKDIDDITFYAFHNGRIQKEFLYKIFIVTTKSFLFKKNWINDLNKFGCDRTEHHKLPEINDVKIIYNNGSPVSIIYNDTVINADIITYLFNSEVFAENAKLYTLLGEYGLSYKSKGYHYAITLNESDLIKMTTNKANTTGKTLPIRIHKSNFIIKVPIVKSKVTKIKESVQLELWNKQELSSHYLEWQAYKRDYPFDYNAFKFLLKRGNKEQAYKKLLFHFVIRQAQKTEITTEHYTYYKVFMRDFSKLTLKHD